MKQPLSLLVAAVAATACAPAVPAGEFRIVGKIENVPDGAVRSMFGLPPANVSRSVVRTSRLGFGRPLRTLRSRRTKTCTVLWSNLKSVS